ncbi:MAG: peptidoglycan DD-metalloendopeptidase family protein [Clostridia bacterium]|nr:peptidoglycan DD-metalloendopeptidase family protein [Clostridia bacterium]
MNKTNLFKAITACVMAFVMVIVIVPFANNVHAIDTSKEAEKALEDKIDTLQNEQAELKKKLEASKTNEAEQEKQKEYLDSLVLSTQNEIDATKQLIEEYTLKIEQKTQEIADLEQEIEDKYEIMVERLRFTYEEGNASYIEMVLESESFTDFLMTVERVGSMLDFDRTLMHELQASLESLEVERAALEETKKAQEETKNALVVKEEDLQGQIDETLAYIEKLQADQDALIADYEKAKAAEEQANNDIAALLAQRAKEQAEAEARAKAEAEANKNNNNNSSGSSGNSNYTPKYGGKLIWPVPGYSRISSYFGPRTLWGRYDYHLGIDIPAPSGTPIRAAADGEVLVSTYHYSYGYYCLIDHGSGYATLYAHNRRLLVSAGDVVKQGQQISEMGTTGSSSGNHLHFEVRINGKVQNPLNYVGP